MIYGVLEHRYLQTNVWIHYAVRCCAEWLWGFIDACRHCPPRSEWILSFHRAPWNSSRPADNDGQSTNHSDLRVRRLQKETFERVRPELLLILVTLQRLFLLFASPFAYFISIELHRLSWKRETRIKRMRMAFFLLDIRIIIDWSLLGRYLFSFAVHQNGDPLRKPRLGNTKPLRYIFRGLITDDADGSIIIVITMAASLPQEIIINDKIHSFREGQCLDIFINYCSDKVSFFPLYLIFINV